jgi:hypothetical protein
MNPHLAAKCLGGDVVGKDRVLAPGPGHSKRDRSLSIIFSGTSFAVHSFAGDDWKLCRDYVAAILGLKSASFDRLAVRDMERMRQEDKERAKKTGKQAFICWKESRPIAGTIAETYLRGRGITCELPKTLRFHPSCWHQSVARIPAMVARVHG